MEASLQTIMELGKSKQEQGSSLYLAAEHVRHPFPFVAFHKLCQLLQSSVERVELLPVHLPAGGAGVGAGPHPLSCRQVLQPAAEMIQDLQH